MQLLLVDFITGITDFKGKNLLPPRFFTVRSISSIFTINYFEFDVQFNNDLVSNKVEDCSFLTVNFFLRGVWDDINLFNQLSAFS